MYHVTAKRGICAAAVNDYERCRPDFPPAHVRMILADALSTQPAARVLEIGAVTGKCSRPLAAALLERQDLPLNCVEPGPFVEHLRTMLPAAHIVTTTADALEMFDDASMDWVVCANALHWFATPAAFREIARVLRPHGRLTVVYLGGIHRDPFWQRVARSILEPLSHAKAPHLQLLPSCTR